MKKIRIGILGTSEIAFRRFLPALKKCEQFEYAGVASRDVKNTDKFVQEFGGKGYAGYDALLEDADIDAVYIPLPPALHFAWAKKALEKGKHILMEKPFTTTLADTEELIAIAREKNLALHENYMFQYHSQIEEIKQIVANGELGDVRLYRIAFGFPKRAENDFRYNKELGGGALLDCGGYTVKLAAMLLGETAKITTTRLQSAPGYEVDLFGSGTMENEEGMTAQFTFGMDNCYKCDLEIWGSTGNLFTGRIFTAPVGFEPELLLQKGNEKEVRKLSADDSFYKSILYFEECMKNATVRLENYKAIVKQGQLVDCF